MPYFVFDRIEFGLITFYVWGLFLGLAFLFGCWFVLREFKKQDIEENKFFWLIIFIVLGGLLGSRLSYILQFPVYYISHIREIFHFWAGGLTFYGGLLGGLAVSWIYIKKTRLNFWQIADILAMALALGIFIGRIGCSLINDHQGAITNLPWAILWPDGTFRHPVAEYLALNGLIIFLVFCFLRGRLKRHGQLFIVFLFWYSISRFLLDFTRAMDTSLADPHYLGLFISQWISIGILMLLGVMIFFGILTKVRTKTRIRTKI